MNTNLMKETNKICNLLMNILRKNTTVNFYERTGYSSRLGLNLGPLFCGSEFKEPIKAKTFHDRNKFDGKCQYNIEFDFNLSKKEHILVKKHYNFSQNYIYICFNLSDEKRLSNIFPVMHDAFDKYKIINKNPQWII